MKKVTAWLLDFLCISICMETTVSCWAAGNLPGSGRGPCSRSAPKLTVISPTLCEGLRRLDEEGKIRYIPRRYFHGDCTCAYLCVAATEDEALNIAISDEARPKEFR